MALAKGTDTYATLAESNVWSENHPYDGGEWALVEDAQKEKLLRYSTKFMDYRFNWHGSPTDQTQPLAFPRTGLTTRNGAAVDPAQIPDELRDATCEFARKLAVSDLTNDQVIEDLKITRAGDISFGKGVMRKVIPSAVRDIIPDSWFGELLDEKDYDAIGSGLFGDSTSIFDGSGY